MRRWAPSQEDSSADWVAGETTRGESNEVETGETDPVDASQG